MSAQAMIGSTIAAVAAGIKVNMLCVPLRAKLSSGLQLDRKLSMHAIKGQTDN